MGRSWLGSELPLLMMHSHPARSNLSRTWTPQHGIVFAGQTPGGYRGLNTAVSEDTLRGLQLLSDAEDSYVMAETVLPETFSAGISSIGRAKARKPVKKEHKRTPEIPEAMKAVVDAKTLEALSGMISKKKSEEAEKDTKAAKKAEKKAGSAAKLEAEAAYQGALLQDPAQNKVPETPTSYKMTEETFRAAKDAKAGSAESYWSHRLYRGAKDETTGAEGKKPIIHYCRSKTTTERVLQSYFMDQKVIGFDIEWKPEIRTGSKTGIRENVSLIQIASEERIALFHLSLYPKGDKVEDFSSPLLKKMLEDPEVTKVGVSIRSDCTRVNKWLDIRTQGMFELSHLNKLVKYSRTKDFGKINKSLISLAKQVQEHLHLPMSKDLNVRAGNWARPLDLNQILYAAADSYAGFQLFHTMEMKRKALNPMPPCPYHVEDDKPIRFMEDAKEEADEKEKELEIKICPKIPCPHTKRSREL